MKKEFKAAMGRILIGIGLAAVLAAGAWAGDKVSRPGAYSGFSTPQYRGVEFKSIYIPMRDGVKIAITYALPKGRGHDERFPAVLYQTRYWRKMAVNPGLGETFDNLVRNGYAVALTDVRGTGASFGVWRFPWSQEEIEDGADVVNWILAQPWSDGQVGTFGTSYTGATAEFLLVNRRLAVKASMIRFSLFDSYSDIAYPGGIRNDWFLDTWNRTDQALDRNDSCTLAKWTGMLPFCLPGTPGVEPAGPPIQRQIELRKAVKEHQGNGDVYAESLKAEYRDHESVTWGGQIELISPYYYKANLEGSGAAIYTMSGWFDGPYTKATVNRFLNLKNCGKLVIGPWPHGGRENISPWRKSKEPGFDHNAEVLRFFDRYLKGIANGIDTEHRVWWYTMGEEAWKSGDAWPPAAETTTYFFGPAGSLATQGPEAKEAADSYRVDNTAGSGKSSRYVSLVNLAGVPIGYPDRAQQDKKLLVYETAPLAEDLEVTGHPVVRLYIDSTANDGYFIVYLEDVSAGGTVSYITEGLLRGIHRQVREDARLYREAPGVPWHTFNLADVMPLVPGEVALLVFDLQPTSVLFRKGHKIRVAIAGADQDHFKPLPGPEPTIRLHRSEDHPSAIDLPVVKR